MSAGISGAVVQEVGDALPAAGDGLGLALGLAVAVAGPRAAEVKVLDAGPVAAEVGLGEVAFSMAGQVQGQAFAVTKSAM